MTTAPVNAGASRAFLVELVGDQRCDRIDRSLRLVKTISLPQTKAGIRGATVAPSTHMLFISYGGDGGGNGNGAVLAYDLLAERVVWTVHLNSGIDSGAVSPDGSRLYVPSGENSASGIWNIYFGPVKLGHLIEEQMCIEDASGQLWRHKKNV